MKHDDIVKRLDPLGCPTIVKPDSYRDRYYELVEEAWSNSVDEPEGSDGKLFRPSSIYKPAITILLSKFYPVPSDFPFSIFDTFFNGRLFEANYTRHLLRTGVLPVEHLNECIQIPCNFDGMNHTGHADILIPCDDGGSILLELKHGNNNYFKTVVKALPNYPDFLRGHITQASLYSYALKPRSTFLILYCYDLRQYLIYHIDQETIDQKNKRSLSVISAYNKTQTVTDCWKYAGIPKPRKERRDRHHTGLYIFPQAMYGSPYCDLVYNVYEDRYIESYAMPDGAELPDDLIETYDELGIQTYPLEDLEYRLREQS